MNLTEEQLILEKVASFSDTDKRIIAKYLLGGAAVGGSLGVGSALMNHIKTMNTESARKRKADDDIIYVDVAKPKAAAVTGGVAMAGGLMSALGSYALVRKAYQDMKKKQVQKELDEAQRRFVRLSAEEGDLSLGKTATARNMTPGEAILGSPVAASLLLMLGSGAFMNHYLNKTNPALKRPISDSPKKIMIRYNDEEEAEKEASLDFHAALEQFIHTTANFPGLDKKASDLYHIVSACAQGRSKELSDNIQNLGVDTALDLIKGASVDADRLYAGSVIAANDPTISPVVGLMACAEFNEAAPSFAKKASALDGETSLLLAGVLECSGREVRKNAFYSEALTEDDLKVLVASL